MNKKQTNPISPLVFGALTIVVLVGAALGSYSYGLQSNQDKIDSLNSELAVANTKITDLTPNTAGQFDRSKAEVGQKFDSWVVTSIDADTGDVVLTSATTPAVVSGLFYSSSDGRPCLVFEQFGFTSGSLPVVVGQVNATFCASSTTSADVLAKFGKGKSYTWAAVEIDTLTYRENETEAAITKVRSNTSLEDSSN